MRPRFVKQTPKKIDAVCKYPPPIGLFFFCNNTIHLPNARIFVILTMLCYVGSQRCPILAIRYSEAESRPRRIVWEVSPRSRNEDTGVLCNVIL